MKLRINFFKPAFLSGTCFLAMASMGLAQGTPPVQQPVGEVQQKTLENVANKDFHYAVPAKVTEGLGRQAFLLKKKFFNISLRESVNYTDNAFRLNNFKRNDFFNSVEFNAGASLTIFKDWTLSARGTLRDFRYNKNPVLDFDSASEAATVNYNTGAWNFYGTGEHTDLYQRGFGLHFFQEDDLTGGLYYSHAMGTRALVYAGGQYTRQFTHPSSSSKHLPTAYIGLITVPIDSLPKLRLTLSGSYSYASYINGGRHDNLWTLGSELAYDFFQWFNASVGVNGGWGRSNQNVFDYDVFNATGYLKFSYQF